MASVERWIATCFVVRQIGCLVLLSDVSCFTVVHAGAFLYDGKGSNMLVSFILAFAWEADVRPLYEKRTHIKKILARLWNSSLLHLEKSHICFCKLCCP